MKKLLHRMNGSNEITALKKELTVSYSRLEEAIENQEKAYQEKIDNIMSNLRQKNPMFDAINKQLVGGDLERIYNRDKEKQSIFILSNHEWGNIGDLAISYTETAFLSRHFPNCNIFNISRLTLLSNWQRIEDAVTDDDIIVLPGGGNMGDIWKREEEARRKIVQTFKRNAIVSFPQSIKFSDTAELKKSAAVYNAHDRLMIATRDDNSFKIASESFQRCNVIRTEDIALSYRYPAGDFGHWDRVIFVMRNDIEKRQGSGIDELYGTLKDRMECTVTDTVIPGFEFVSTEYGAKLTYHKVDELHASSLVVVDRLHAAIFALAAGRPIIVFDNSYGKIQGALKNIKRHLPDRILFANNDGSSVTLDEVNRLRGLQEHQGLPADLLGEEFDLLAKELKRHLDY